MFFVPTLVTQLQLWGLLIFQTAAENSPKLNPVSVFFYDLRWYWAQLVFLHNKYMLNSQAALTDSDRRIFQILAFSFSLCTHKSFAIKCLIYV